MAGTPYLTRQQNVLARLRHGTVGGGYNQDGSIHLRRARVHVFYIVGMARTVNVSIVTVFRLVLDVTGIDRDAASLFFGRLVNGVVGEGSSLRRIRPGSW